MGFHEYWAEIKNLIEQLSQLTDEYWRNYSYFNDWQFWVVFLLFIIPLFILIKYVDRNRIFELFFFGWTIHVLWNYTGMYLENQLYFIHYYYLTPMLPSIFTAVSSSLPVAFILVYQYCTKYNKNFYLWMVGVSIAFSFGLAYVEKMIGFIEMNKGFNYFHLFLIDIAVVLTAYWSTRFLIHIRNKANHD
ncbi:hypothetical protein [Piscibacillus halophilus]|uniref:hypothetical protein n=1 Tax=Piscibacillus halophilus TaxID=571933 RepID=UPI002409DD96|nr:hypothetical protein [Piscibacillus halophilus]